MPKAVVVGGSIAGVACAHALISAGWHVAVLEKSRAPPTGSPTGAGLGLDPLSCGFVASWLSRPGLIHRATIPLSIEHNQCTESEKKISFTLSRDESFNFRAAYWADLHGLLYSELPQHVFFWGHLFVSFCMPDDKTCVKVKAKNLLTEETIEILGDVLVAADGCFSSVRQTFLPDLKLRYSGYCAWRGVLDFSEDENSETIMGIRKVYPDLGRCLYFDLGFRTHIALYELPKKRLNWIWYINQPEPKLEGNSMTMNVSGGMIQKMNEAAEKDWVPELARAFRETKEPFVNTIYDCEPLEQLTWGRVVLVGDAAHPTTPHGLRSTNMSIVDAEVLGRCLGKWGPGNVHLALEEYQATRLPVVGRQVLHSRRLGCLKQGLALPGSREDWEELLQRCMPFFEGVPLPN